MMKREFRVLPQSDFLETVTSKKFVIEQEKTHFLIFFTKRYLGIVRRFLKRMGKADEITIYFDAHLQIYTMYIPYTDGLHLWVEKYAKKYILSNGY